MAVRFSDSEGSKVEPLSSHSEVDSDVEPAVRGGNGTIWRPNHTEKMWVHGHFKAHVFRHPFLHSGLWYTGAAPLSPTCTWMSLMMLSLLLWWGRWSAPLKLVWTQRESTKAVVAVTLPRIGMGWADNRSWTIHVALVLDNRGEIN